jgi:ribosomal protein S18 acetylase RimI-like enzyme
MQILDLRQVHSKTLEPLFQEEAHRWQVELHWDYLPSIDLIRKFVDTRSLGGNMALNDGKPIGYGYFVLEDFKGLIGGLFVSSRVDQAPVNQRLLREMFQSLSSTPHLQRIEAQLMPFGTELDPAFLSQFFRLYSRQFMLLKMDQAKLSGKPLSSGLRIEPWSDRILESAGRLIQLSYAGHVDAEINDQYRTEAGGMRFLRNIVLLPGCGQFLPEASFLVRPASGDSPVGMVLTSTVASGVGHTTQVCVKPGHQGHGIGRQLMEHSIQALSRRGYKMLSLTVTAANRGAVKLYEDLGFHTIKSFAAGVWQQ